MNRDYLMGKLRGGAGKEKNKEKKALKLVKAS